MCKHKDLNTRSLEQLEVHTHTRTRESFLSRDSLNHKYSLNTLYNAQTIMICQPVPIMELTELLVATSHSEQKLAKAKELFLIFI